MAQRVMSKLANFVLLILLMSCSNDSSFMASQDKTAAESPSKDSSIVSSEDQNKDVNSMSADISDKETDQSEGIPGYLTDPKSIDNMAVVFNENLTLSSIGADDAVASDVGSLTEMSVVLLEIGRQNFLDIYAQGNNSYNFTATYLDHFPVSESGSFNITGSIDDIREKLIIVSVIKTTVVESQSFNYKVYGGDKANSAYLRIESSGTNWSPFRAQDISNGSVSKYLEALSNDCQGTAVQTNGGGTVMGNCYQSN